MSSFSESSQPSSPDQIPKIAPRSERLKSHPSWGREGVIAGRHSKYTVKTTVPVNGPGQVSKLANLFGVVSETEAWTKWIRTLNTLFG
jgi:hypothetical protein